MEQNEDDPDQLAETLKEVTRTQFVSLAEARALGFWHDAYPDDNPPMDDDGRVEVPAWRHALINYPHPLLRQGLVVLDTPGLNAIGAEPELTLSLLPSAHATVFILGADTGVTKSDLAIWRDHLSTSAPAVRWSSGPAPCPPIRTAGCCLQTGAGRAPISSCQRLKYLNSSMSWPCAFQFTVHG